MEEAKLRIAMLSVHSSPLGRLGTNDNGGMSVYVREIARELGEKGHSVDIFTRLQDPEANQILNLDENVRLIHLRAGNKGYMSKLEVHPFLPDLFYELERFRGVEMLHYDLVHSHYWLSGRVGEYAQKGWRVPHIVTFHTLGAVKNDTDGVEREPELRIVTERELVKTCHGITAATEREKEQLIHYYDAAPDSIRMVPCGVNRGLFRPSDKFLSRQQLGFDQEESLLLCVGRFAPSKGTDRLLEAMTYLREDGPFRLLIIGGDDFQTPEARRLRQLVQESDLQKSVTFVGRIEHEKLATYYSAADALVVPSRYESFSLVALESLACGTPVVATRVGAMESIVKEGETGYLLNNGSAPLLAKGIKSFLSRSHAFSTAEISASVAGFGWADVASTLIAEYKGLLQHGHDASRKFQ